MAKKRGRRYEVHCAQCGVWFTGFQKNTRFCTKVCALAVWVPKNKDRIRGHGNNYQFSAKGKAKRKDWEIREAESQKEKKRIYYEENKDAAFARALKRKAEKPDEIRAYQSKWRKTDLGRKISLDTRHRRIARQKNAPGDHFTMDQFHVVCDEFDDHCLCCLRKLDRKKLEADHVVPISRGGSNGIENIQPLCRRCNPRKGVLTIDYRPTFWWRGPSRM